MTESDDEVRPSPQSPTVALMDSFLTMGGEKLVGVCAALSIVVGFFAPLATAQTGGMFSSGSISFSISQAGFSGILILALGLVIALLPFYKDRATFADRNIFVFGVSCALFGTFLSMWFASLSLPIFISAIGGLSIGFYATLVGFGLNVYANGKTLKSASPTT